MYDYAPYSLQRERYELLRFFEETASTMPNGNTILADRIRRQKEIIRKQNKEYTKALAEQPRGYGSFDYATQFYRLCDGKYSKEEACEIFEEYEYIEPTHSQYDCTGCLFTTGYHVLKYKGDWWVIHHTAIDV